MSKPALDPDAVHPQTDDDASPRPRPGFRSQRAEVVAVELAGLFAGVLRGTVGMLGFFASLLLLPVHTLTPILAGVSVVLAVTGNVSAFRAVTRGTRMRIVPTAFAIVCVVAAATTVLLTVVVGAGAFRARSVAQAPDGPPTIQFESAR